MMDELKDKLHSEQCSLVVLHEGNIRTFDGRGVRTLYDLMTNEPEVLLDAKLADKAVGRTAARMMAEGGVCYIDSNHTVGTRTRISFETGFLHNTVLCCKNNVVAIYKCLIIESLTFQA